MKVATWNVNSLGVRLPQVLDWIRDHDPDVLALQETKLEDHRFPVDEFERLGYQASFSGQKAYNGVAVITKAQALDGLSQIPNLDDPQKRVLAVTIEGIRIINLYVPNGSEVGSEKYRYKLDWLDHLLIWLEGEIRLNPRIIVLGDFNIAPEALDVHDPDLWEGKILCSAQERRAYFKLLDLGFQDAFRRFSQPEKSYSWWDYRMNGFRRNLGLRIDHILVGPDLCPVLKDCQIDRVPRANERPSDHAPVVAVFGP